MAFIRTNGVLLHYRLDGRADAPVVVLANSLGTDARIWDRVIDILAANYRVLSYDKRGHGLSDAPPGDYSLDDHTGDIAALADHIGAGQFALAGVSIGGVIAQGFALRYPERLAALVLCDTAPRMGDRASWEDRVAKIRRGGLASIADAIMERWFSERFRRDRPDDVAGWRNLFVRTDTEGYCGSCATLRDTDLGAQLGRIATPTLVVAGEGDTSISIDAVRACAAAIARARFETIADAGHIPSIEQPAVLAALMTTFFKEVGHG